MDDVFVGVHRDDRGERHFYFAELLLLSQSYSRVAIAFRAANLACLFIDIAIIGAGAIPCTIDGHAIVDNFRIEAGQLDAVLRNRTRGLWPDLINHDIEILIGRHIEWRGQ